MNIVSGQKFHFLTVVALEQKTSGKKYQRAAICVCECGKVLRVRTDLLKHQQSCGCKRREEQYIARRHFNNEGFVTHKDCTSCKKRLPRESFGMARSKRDGLRDVCIKCRKSKETSRSIQKLYGVSIQQFNQMLIQQKGACAICLSTNPGGNSGNFHVDHDHTTKVVRGLLCSRCNTAIGLLSEDLSVFERATNYLKKHKTHLTVHTGGLNA